MSEYPFHIVKIPESDFESFVDRLYEYVMEAKAKEEKIPNNVRLWKLAREEFQIGLLESRKLVRRMEEKYDEALEDIGYYNDN